MTSAQRKLVLSVLLVLSVSSAVFCLDFRTQQAFRYGEQMFDLPLVSPLRPAIPPLFSVQEVVNETVKEGVYVTISGVFPRRGLSFESAIIGGLLAPLLFLSGALYLLLGTDSSGKIRLGKDNLQSAGTTPQADPLPPPPSKLVPSRLQKWAGVTGAVFPVLFVLDMPSMLLAMGMRFPMWVFVAVLLRTLASVQSQVSAALISP